MAVNPEMKPLMPKQREFIHLIVYQGLSREEAYAQSHKVSLKDTPIEKLRSRASNAFYTPHVNNYYHALMEEVRDNDVKKAVWTKDVATEKLMRLIERAEEDLYGVDKDGNPVGNQMQLTMGRLNAIVLPVKELNLMNGLNQTNVNVEGCIVQITGEEDIPD